MKKKMLKIMIPVAVLLAVIILAEAIYLTPKTFAGSIEASDVDHIEVFDGNTGVRFTVGDQEDIRYIVENLRSHPMKRAGISLGYSGWSFRLKFFDSDGNELIRSFIINSEDTIRCDPFFYRCSGGLCFDYLKSLENVSAAR